jgi:hypothetical protein
MNALRAFHALADQQLEASSAGSLQMLMHLSTDSIIWPGYDPRHT